MGSTPKLDPEELKRIHEASSFIHNNTMRGEPEWIWKGRQKGFERIRAGMLEEHLRDLLFEPEKDVRKLVFALAVKIIKGDAEFTPEELQLQANEPEELEKTLRELNEWLSKRT